MARPFLDGMGVMQADAVCIRTIAVAVCPALQRTDALLTSMPAHLATVRAVPSDATLVALLDFNVALLAQARVVAQAHTARAEPAFAALAGPHLRHVIEHHAALVDGVADGLVDYDVRPRDRTVEEDPRVADTRLEALQQALAALDPRLDVSRELRVRQCVGLDGETVVTTPSCFGRELAFVASHAIHHFALLRAYCAQHAIAVDADFGLAPSTVAHLRRD
ncbi:MAG: hypothetical protein MUF30_01745 [Burkholderiales bacterium]|nr:hypothetical protein [Burkholderiales bacterium]